MFNRLCIKKNLVAWVDTKCNNNQHKGKELSVHVLNKQPQTKTETYPSKEEKND